MPCLGDRIAAPSCLDCDREGACSKSRQEGILCKRKAMWSIEKRNAFAHPTCRCLQGEKHK